MLNKTSGIILQTTKYSETSLIVKMYTEGYGLQSYIVSGVRSKKSKNKASLFQPLALVDFVFTGNERSSLHRISEINISQPYNQIPYNIVKSTIALFLNEILVKALKETHADEDLFHFLKSSLQILDLEQNNSSNFHLCFMFRLSRYLGFYPQGAYTDNTSIFDLQEGTFVNYIPRHPHYLNSSLTFLLSSLMNLGYDEIMHFKIDRTERKMLLNALALFFQLHISSFGAIKSLDVLEEVIS
jgi:DNA repair protein RecO (recombination protein O)